MTVERTGPAPVPLDDAPEVNAFLERMNLGGLTEDDLLSYPGRNDIWAGTTSRSERVFVKRISGPADDTRVRLARIEKAGALLFNHPLIRTPRCHRVDTDHRLAVFEMIDGASSGSELAEQDLFTEKLAEQAGRVLGALHSLTPPEDLPEVAHGGLSSHQGFFGISLAHFAGASGGELDAWGLLQGDEELVEALVRTLTESRPSTPTTLVHGDLRLDQFLVKDDTLYLTDWEECRVDDPARDIGAFAGEWLYRGVLAMSAGADDPVGEGSRRFDLLRPNIERFWSAYLDARPEAGLDNGLTVRATSFAGWHLFDRVFAAAQQDFSLSPLQKAAAGVGRQALLAPADFTTALGLEEQ